MALQSNVTDCKLGTDLKAYSTQMKRKAAVDTISYQLSIVCKQQYTNTIHEIYNVIDCYRNPHTLQ